MLVSFHNSLLGHTYHPLSRGDKYDLREYYEKKPTPETNGENPLYKGKNYKPWKDGAIKRQPEIGVNENSGRGGNPQTKVRCTLCNNDISKSN